MESFREPDDSLLSHSDIVAKSKLMLTDGSTSDLATWISKLRCNRKVNQKGAEWAEDPNPPGLVYFLQVVHWGILTENKLLAPERLDFLSTLCPRGSDQFIHILSEVTTSLKWYVESYTGECNESPTHHLTAFAAMSDSPGIIAWLHEKGVRSSFSLPIMAALGLSGDTVMKCCYDAHLMSDAIDACFSAKSLENLKQMCRWFLKRQSLQGLLMINTHGKLNCSFGRLLCRSLCVSRFPCLDISGQS